MLEKLVELIFTLSLFINAGLFIPQAMRLYKTKHARDLSLTTFLGFNLTQIAIIAHGYYHHDWLLTFGYLLSFITCALVTLLIIFYSIKNSSS